MVIVSTPNFSLRTHQTSPASPALGNLLAIMAAQGEAYRQLHQLAAERHAALVAADADRLSDMVGREQPLMTHLRKLEEARLQAIQPWAQYLGCVPEQLTVSQLCTLLDPVSAAALVAAKDQLLAVSAALAAQNRTNANLLQACIDSINASVQQLVEAVRFNPRYASDGHRLDHGESPRLTDLRA